MSAVDTRNCLINKALLRIAQTEWNVKEYGSPGFQGIFCTLSKALDCSAEREAVISNDATTLCKLGALEFRHANWPTLGMFDKDVAFAS